MVAPLPRYLVTLTGKRRGRITATGKLVVQVEERTEKLEGWPPGHVVTATHHRWIDAGRHHVTAYPRVLELPGFDADEPMAGPKIAPPPRKP